MAKPTGAKEQSDYGLDITSATKTSPMYLYHAMPVYRQAAEWSNLSIPSGMTPHLRIRSLVGTDTTLRAEISMGSPSSGSFTEETQASSESGEKKNVGEPPEVGFFNKAGNPEISAYFWWVPVIIKCWCESTGTGPDTTELESINVQLKPTGSLGTGFGFTSTPHQTAADRLYKANRALTAYHVRKLLIASVNALVYSSGAQANIPIYGTYV